ncbi:MAG: type II secretion system protein GspH [Comamonadaceae bacterium]|nr:MAG: type II secretion system protein GspH [Comamonadaceae bacterium]
MPTWAAGSNPGHSRGRAVQGAPSAPGFTLIELLVVIAIIAFATAGVSFAIRDSAQAQFDREAERLAALLEAGRAQSRASGTAVRWRVTPEGFTFDGLPLDTLPAHWTLAGVSAQALDGQGGPLFALQLGPEPIIPAQQVLMSTDGPPARSLRVVSDGLRPFSVQAP